jgi:hypothetical protein
MPPPTALWAAFPGGHPMNTTIRRSLRTLFLLLVAATFSACCFHGHHCRSFSFGSAHGHSHGGHCR